MGLFNSGLKSKEDGRGEEEEEQAKDEEERERERGGRSVWLGDVMSGSSTMKVLGGGKEMGEGGMDPYFWLLPPKVIGLARYIATVFICVVAGKVSMLCDLSAAVCVGVYMYVSNIHEV